MASAAFLGFLLLLVTVDVIGVQVAYAGRMYPGTHALGLDIGGLPREDARATLQQRAAELADRPITIGHQELRWTISARNFGAEVDVDRLVGDAYALGRDGNLFYRFFLQFGLVLNGGAYEVKRLPYDLPGMSAFMEALANAVNRPVTDASVAIKPDGEVQFVEAMPGRRLQVEPTQQRLEAALSRTDLDSVQLAVEETPPKVGSEDLATARAQVRELMSSPISLTFEDSTWELPVRDLGAMARLDERGQLTVNREAATNWTARLAKEVSQDPQNARFTWNNGDLQLIRPSKDGRVLDVDRTVELIMAKAFAQERTIALPVAVTKADVSQDDGPKLGIKGPIEIARTSFAGSQPPKRHNINLAAQRLNGVVVPPGKLFSFNREVGPTTLDNGYQLGWAVANGGNNNVRTVPAAAGGICQVATTLFHSVFWGGYQVEERNYHLYWIPGYTTHGLVGLDATVEEDLDLDFRFYNNTEHYMLIQAWTEGSSVVFGLYGTKPDWAVKVTPGERSDIVEASREQVTEEEPTLPAGARVAVEGAQDGYKISHVRTVTRGNDVRTLRLTSVYRPSRNVTVVGTGGRPARPPQVAVNQATRATDAAPATQRAAATPSTQAAPAAGQSSATTRPASASATAAPAATSASQPASKPTVQPTRQTAPATPARPTPAPTSPR